MKISGKKTYIAAALVAVITFLKEAGIEIPDMVTTLLVVAGAASLRAAISKVDKKVVNDGDDSNDN